MSFFTTGVLVVAILLAGPASAQQSNQGQPDLELQVGDPQNRSIGAGSCSGFFHDPQAVNGFLEWGLESHCAGSGWFPHHISVTLQKQRKTPWFPDIFFDDIDTMASESYQFGWADISLLEHNNTICANSDQTVYRLEGTITAGENEVTGISEEFTLYCGVET
ncbi:hypothetical protein [Nocardia camponoti]|nr:hypothetical protein [Nocardia camponoti]